MCQFGTLQTLMVDSDVFLAQHTCICSHRSDMSRPPPLSNTQEGMLGPFLHQAKNSKPNNTHNEEMHETIHILSMRWVYDPKQIEGLGSLGQLDLLKKSPSGDSEWFAPRATKNRHLSKPILLFGESASLWRVVLYTYAWLCMYVNVYIYTYCICYIVYVSY